jgi:hypothetical protein
VTHPDPPTPQWAVTVRPGDTLVLGFSGDLTPLDIARAREVFAERCPGVNVVFAAGVDSMVVQRAGDADA